MDTPKTIFDLCFDDFGIKYYKQEDLDQPLNTLQKNYDILYDITGSNYIGLEIDWNYKEKYVDISMPDCVLNALKKTVQHPIDNNIPQINRQNQFTVNRYDMYCLIPLSHFLIKREQRGYKPYTRNYSIIPELQIRV